MKIKEFFKLAKWKLTLFILLLLILIFLRLYPVDTTSCSSWTQECHNKSTFRSLYGVVKNGFDWSPEMLDASIHYVANPLYLVLYIFYVFLSYTVASVIIFLYKIKFLVITKSRLIIFILSLLSFAPILTRLFGFNYTSFTYGIGEFIGIILRPFHFLNVFLFSVSNIFLKLFDFGSAEYNRLNISLHIRTAFIENSNSLLLGFIIVIFLWYLIICLIMFTYDKIKKKIIIVNIR